MHEDKISFQVRLSTDVQIKLRYLAKQEKRSKNAEIEFIVRRYIEQYENQNGELTDQEMEEFLFEGNDLRLRF